MVRGGQSSAAPHPVGLTTIGAGLLLAMMGCSTTSTIVRIHERPLEGDIVGGSPDAIFVQTDSGREYEIERDEVSSIDFPGNVHRNAGLAVLAYGAVNIALGMSECNERTDDKAAFCVGVFTPAAIGLGLIAWGLAVHHGQTSAVADTSRRSRAKPRDGASNATTLHRAPGGP